jgi:hypothetical protein
MICVSTWRICIDRMDSTVSPTNPISLRPTVLDGELDDEEVDETACDPALFPFFVFCFFSDKTPQILDILPFAFATSW